jgi:hypothetical protein
MYILSYMSGENRRSIMHGIPMQYLDQVKQLFANDGYRIRIKYRGPRAMDTGRSYYARKGTCLKSSAVSFAVYSRS